MSEPLQLLERVAELHAEGYERLRITPYLAPSGAHWRLQLTAPGTDDTLTWSTASEQVDTVAELVTGHPELLAHARGADPAYAAWLHRVVDLARQGWTAYFFADWETTGDGVPLLGPADGAPQLEEPPGGR